MKSRLLSVFSMFIISLIIGYNILPAEELQATTLVIPSRVEMPYLYGNLPEEESSEPEEINIEVDLTTEQVSINGNSDAKVNVTTYNRPKPIVKWKTKVVEIEKSEGYPYVKHVGQLPDSVKPISILKAMNNGKE